MILPSSKVWNESARGEVPLFPVLAALGALYVFLIVVFSPHQLKNDEHRYFAGANNLTKGFFVSADHPDFTNGPGYPLILTPVMSLLGFEFDRLNQNPADYDYTVPGPDGQPIESSLKWRLLPLRLLNAVFLTVGLYFIFRAARLFVTARTALIIVLIVGLNPFQLRWVHVMMTESVTPLLFGGFAWAYVSGLRSGRFSWKLVLAAGAVFGMLALTRTIFGYVVVAALVVIPVVCFLFGKRQMIWKAAGPMIVALVICLPYLSYTHHHTGRLFCWSTNGGELVYWITSPHEGEFGNWQQEKWIVKDPVLSANHLEFIRHVNSLPVLERRDAWSKGVRKNLQSEGIEKALARNYLANLTRAFLGAPLTRQYQTFPKLVWILTGFCFLIPALLAFFLTLRCWRSVAFELKLLLLIALIYFGGAMLLPTGPRYWIPILPAILIWIGYMFENFLSIQVRVLSGSKEKSSG